MNTEFSPQQSETERRRPSSWRGFLRHFGLSTVEPVNQTERNRSLSTIDNGTADESQPPTIRDVLAKLDEQRAADVPPGLPIPYELGNQMYPGTALWQTTKTPEDYAAGLRALKSYDPPHVLAEREGAPADNGTMY